jgi:RimJ/RimL family protein N-acetyltransferase
MNDTFKLKSARTIIRQLRDSDFEPFLQYRCDPDVARFQLWDSFSQQDAVEFIKKHKSAQPGTPGEWIGLAIALEKTGDLIGDCAFKISDEDPAQAEIGFNLSPRFQGRGFATEAVRCLLDYLLCELDLHRVTAVTDCENAAAVALLERVGMRREGHFLQNVWFKGRWGDEYLYAILQDEWIKNAES